MTLTTTLTSLFRRTLPTTPSPAPVRGAPLQASIARDLQALDGRILAAQQQVQAQQALLRTALFTPQAHQAALAKLDALQAELASLQSRRRVLSAEAAGSPAALSAQDLPQLKAERQELSSHAEALKATMARALMTPEAVERSRDELQALAARVDLVDRFQAQLGANSALARGLSSFG